MIFPVEPRNFAGRDTFAYWEDFLSLEQINYILALPHWINTDRAQIGGPNGGTLNEEIRRTNIGWMGVTEETLSIWKSIGNTISEVNRRYFHFDLTGCYEPAQLGLYTDKEQSHYVWHTDASMQDNKAPRKLSMVLCLSNPCEFEGGELQIKVENDEIQKLELKLGRAWFFPSWVLHRVTPVTKGVRRSLVLWVGGPPFR
jgi:PKHD-type hydroxylase